MESTRRRTSSSATANASRPLRRKAKKLTSFTLFTKLPAEIQIMIWRSMFPGPREMKLIRERDQWSVGYNDPFFPGPIFSFSPNPITLQICHQSRLITLERYKPYIFPANSTYIDPAIDILGLDAKVLRKLEALSGDTDSQGRGLNPHIRNLVFFWTENVTNSLTVDEHYRRRVESQFQSIFRTYSGLETLVIIWYPGSRYLTPNIERLHPVRALFRAALQARQYKADHPDWSLPELSMERPANWDLR